jgi:hypothetical protein
LPCSQYIPIQEYVKRFFTNLSATLFPLLLAAQNGFAPSDAAHGNWPTERNLMLEAAGMK